VFIVQQLAQAIAQPKKMTDNALNQEITIKAITMVNGKL
jgi:hypothetical protein